MLWQQRRFYNSVNTSALGDAAFQLRCFKNGIIKAAQKLCAHKPRSTSLESSTMSQCFAELGPQCAVCISCVRATWLFLLLHGILASIGIFPSSDAVASVGCIGNTCSAHTVCLCKFDHTLNKALADPLIAKAGLCPSGITQAKDMQRMLHANLLPLHYLLL